MKRGFWGLLLLLWIQTTFAHASEINFVDARAQGSFNIGAAQASLSRMFVGEPINHELLVIDYQLPGQTAAGVWAKDFPAALAKGQVDVVKAAIYLSDTASGDISTALELKGDAGTQRLPLSLKPGANQIRALLDWNSIGQLNEAVLLIQRTGGPDPAVGQIQFDLVFQPLPLLEKLYANLWGRVGGVIVFSVLLGLMAAAFRPQKSITVNGFWRDLAFGVAAVLMSSAVMATYTLGTSNPLDNGWLYLYVPAAGWLASLVLKLSLTGQRLSVREAVWSALFPGLLAAAASQEDLWMAPDSLTSFYQLSGFGAALFVLIFHLANSYQLAVRKKHLDGIRAAVIVATPFVFGLLLALQTFHHFFIQVLLIFVVGEFVANAASLVNRERLLSAIRVHVVLAVLALLVTVAPDIAALGSGATAASLPGGLRPFVAVITSMLSQGPLWAMVYLLTGLVLGAIRGNPPHGRAAQDDAIRGLKKGMVFSGVLMGLLQTLHVLVDTSLLKIFFHSAPLLFCILAGAAIFPLLKTIIETFDGSQSFFRRAALAYQKPTLLLRGVVLGLAVAIGLGAGFPELPTSTRIGFGALAGALVFSGVSLLRDGFLGMRALGHIRSSRSYLLEGGLGLFIGAGIGFYLDAAQLPIILTKFELYNSFGLEPMEIVRQCQQLRTTAPNEFTALISRWGHITLPAASGGAQILFNEALMGVIGWGIAAPLFAINKAFLTAVLDRDTSAIKRLSTRAGITELADGTIYVLRWGLWMAPIIFTFLRPMAEATWYNQDGLIRTGFAVVNSLTHDADGFTAWSLNVFTWIIGYAWFQVLIWIDHMGLRVATLVNLSFIGLDRLDERFAAFVGRDATARFIPEGVKRFATWAPLLIPFYLPAGAQWEKVFNAGSALQAQQAGGSPGLRSLLIAAVLLAGGVTLLFTLHRKRRERRGDKEGRMQLMNNTYSVALKSNGELYSSLRENEAGVSRCAFEAADPSGRVLFVVERADDDRPLRAWPVLGNFPEQIFHPSTFTSDAHQIRVVNTAHGVRTTITITLPDRDDAAELWDIELEDLSGQARKLMLVPYLEWMLNRPDADRNHTQYNRLYPEISYRTDLNALVALHRSTKLYGWLAASVPPQGLLMTRVDFIGRAGSIWTPRALETLQFQPALNAGPCPMFDPIGALMLDTPVAAHGQATCRMQIGCDKTEERIQALVLKHLKPQIDASLQNQWQAKRIPQIGHGEMPAGTPQPYTHYCDDGNTLQVLTPFTPRPFDHEMSNALGHVVAVTNHGLHTSASGNSQQNRLTPDRSDVVGTQIPSEAIYLYDEVSGDWFSPCYDPLKDCTATHTASFSLDGSAVFTMCKGDLETELAVHVPLEDPVGVYLLTVRNTGKKSRRLRIAPYFQIVLAHSPESAGPLQISHGAGDSALFFKNPRNRFHSGTCFVAMSETVAEFTVRRGSFFGAGRAFSRPLMVEQGTAAPAGTDKFPVAALLAGIELPPGGERVMSIVLGQAGTQAQAEACVRKFRSVDTAAQSLQSTRDWWMALQSTLTVKTSDPQFDSYVRWMKYQTLSERIWARKGFYQASGAYGFRDQLQDTVNMIWVDPVLARAQLIVNAAQQFREGDVAHWFFLRQDGRTGFLSRSHASDNPLWLGWGVGEYLRMTGDQSILDEQVSYLEAETPLAPLPAGKHGMGFFPLRSSRSDSVFNHVMRAMDLVLEKRMGRNGLPLMGTGDWNDGFDAIGSEGRGESVWMGFFLVCVLKSLLPLIRERRGMGRGQHYAQLLMQLEERIETTWRSDRYLRAIHDDGTEIGVAGAGYWETDALGASWAVFAGINPQRSRIALDTALRVLEQDKVISLGWPPLRADIKPYLGRSATYPEGVRENGMYSHGVQWLTRACRMVSEQLAQEGESDAAQHYRDAAVRLWYKISAIPHVRGAESEIYGGQPNQQCADYLTLHDPGRMIWSGYTGAAGWMLRQACESIVGAELENNAVKLPEDMDQPRDGLRIKDLSRNLAGSPFQ